MDVIIVIATSLRASSVIMTLSHVGSDRSRCTNALFAMYKHIKIYQFVIEFIERIEEPQMRNEAMNSLNIGRRPFKA